MAQPAEIARHLALDFLDRFPDEAALQLNQLPADDVLELLSELGEPARGKVFMGLDREWATDLVPRMTDELVTSLFGQLDPPLGALIVSRLDSAERARVLGALPPGARREYVERLSYPPDSAGQLMDAQVMAFRPEATVESVLRRLRDVKGRRIADICVVDAEGKLTGTVPLQLIAVSRPAETLAELASGGALSVNGMADREDVVTLMEQHRLASLPVVDSDGTLLGIIRHDRMFLAAQEEASEDLVAMFGAGREERALSRVSLAVRKRLPWLQINLATAFLAATVVGLFESTIARFTALAVFLPVVAGQSGNTGSQALAVTMRGLALREIRPRQWLRVAGKEMSVGFINGVAVALTTSFIVWLWMSSLGLAAVIGAAMVISMVVAGLSGAVIPMALKTMGQDPAQSSSIVLTTITDVVGFLSFLGLAQLFATYLML